MKVLKDVEQGLLFSVFGLGGKWYLQAAVSLFFRLDAPDTPLPEKELWQCAQARLPKGTVLDAGYPKPSGEFFVAGSCFPPCGPAPAGRVAVRVGPLFRELTVFGDREWVRGPCGAAPGPAKAFFEMPITWARAFGGPGFAENPEGKGAETGNSCILQRPLPNVEDPAALVGQPSDTPAPASFLPAPLSSPHRLAKAGTYGAQWRNTRWPGLPDDVDMSIFNLAAPRQVLPSAFFKGGEAVAVEGMHPQKPVLEGRLPRKRVRLFLTRVHDPKKPGEARFEEVSARLETVWLFPAEERCAVFYRAVVETADDEHADIKRLFIAVEDQDEEAKSLEFYRDEQQRRLSRAVNVDKDALNALQPKVDEAARTVRTLPQDVAQTLDAASGKGPTLAPPGGMPMGSRQAQAQSSLAQVEAARNRLGAAKEKYGHLAKIDVGKLDALHVRLTDLLSRMQEGEGSQTEAAASAAKVKQAMCASVRNGSSSDLVALQDAVLRKQGLDPATLAPIPRPEDLWPEAAARLLAEAREGLFSDPSRLAVFTGSGLRRRDVRRAFVGWLPEAREFDPAEWGLGPDDLPKEMNGRLVVGPGLLVPHFQGARCVRLAVRSMAAQVGAGEPVPALPCPESVVPGSMEGVQALGTGHGRPVVVAPDPLAAWLLYAEIGDVYGIVIPTSAGAKALEGLGEVLRDAPLAFLPLSPDDAPDAETAASLVKPFAALAPGLRPHVWPKDDAGPNLFAAAGKGLDIRAWMLDPWLDAASHPSGDEGANEPGADRKAPASIRVPKFDVKGVAASARERAAAQVVADNEAIGLREKMLEQTRQELAAHGLDPKLADARPPLPPHRPDPEMLAIYDQAKDNAQTPEAAARVVAAKAEYVGRVERLGQLREQGLANLDAARARIANPEPSWAAQSAATPEKVLALKDSGGSLAGMDLSDLDFSGQDLCGLDFTRAIIRGTNFSHAKLDGARFDQTVGGKTIFTGASLRGAHLRQAVLPDSDFTRADLTGANAELSELSKCRFAQTILDKGTFDKSQFADSEFSETVCNGASFRLCMVRGGQVVRTRFEGTSFYRCAFDRTAFSKVSFLGGRLASTLFLSCAGENMRFSDADCSNLRLLRGSAFPDATFAGCDLSRASFRDSSLQGSSFGGCTFQNAGIHCCDLSGCDLSGCKAMGARIRKSDLSKAKLKRLNLRGGSLRKSRLLDSDLTGANLYGVDFYKTVFNQTGMAGANLKHSLIESHAEFMRQEGMLL